VVDSFGQYVPRYFYGVTAVLWESFRTLEPIPDLQRLLGMPGEFAFYAGVGWQTAQGMGQVRVRSQAFPNFPFGLVSMLRRAVVELVCWVRRNGRNQVTLELSGAVLKRVERLAALARCAGREALPE